MDPPNPPLPTPWNLPFQLASGIHTSILMSESVDGLNVAATRQNADGWAICPVTGEENVPVATDCANVILVFGNESAWRLSQVAARDAEPMQRTIRKLKPRRSNS